MTGPILASLLALASAVAIARRRRRVRLPTRAVIVSPRRSTAINERGAVRSVQSAEVTTSAAELERLWNPKNLERLGRTYWRFLSRVTLGLIRVVYGERERSVVLLVKPLTLLRFDAPEYLIENDHGNIRWRIRDGLLVARAGRGCGFLALDVRRHEPGPDDRTKVRIDVEVSNFYPAIAAGIGMPVYRATQSVVHVLVTHAFLRSLGKLDLAVSKVGRFDTGGQPEAALPDAPDPADPADPADPPLSRSGRP
jgi:hypothetical protein